MKLGSAIHTAILEPATFDHRYVVAPKVDRRTKYGKEVWETFVAASAGRECLTHAEYMTCQRIAESVRGNDAAQTILSHGHAEVTVVWNDPLTGVACKARLDWLSPDTAIMDVKSTESAAPQDFRRKVANYGWHVQAAWYADGYEIATGQKLPFIFAAVEKDAPNGTAYYVANEESLAAGRRKYRRLLDTYAACLKAGAWPSYAEEIQELTLPVWALKEDDDRNESTSNDF